MLPYSVSQLAQLLKESGDKRSLKAIDKFIVRHIHMFPGARKLNPEKETSPWMIPVEDAERWLEIERDSGI
jgi:hypothetical protein